MSLPRIGVVIVTMGTRPEELAALLDSVARQSGQAAHVVVVGYGTPLTGVPRWVTGLPLEENLGCPAGRNAGLRLLLGPGDVDVIVELDDDGLLIADDVFERVQRLYAADPALGSSRSGWRMSRGERCGVMFPGWGRVIRCGGGW